MQELLARLKSLDPEASLALRVIACFDELIRGCVNTQGLLGAAASMSGCVAGYSRDNMAAEMCVSPDGKTMEPRLPADSSVNHESGGLRVWLERVGEAEANDAMILQRLALALSIRFGRLTEDPLGRLGRLLDPCATSDERRAAATQLGLSARARYRVVSLPLFAVWGAHPEMVEDVVPSVFGPMHVCIVPEEMRYLDARPCGVGAAMPAGALHRSYAMSLVSLRLCALPKQPIVVADDYGGLVELLAQCSVDQPLMDVEELEDIMQNPWASSTIDALLRSASAREAARLAHVHHSTMQTRLTTIKDALDFDPLDGLGRTRIGIAYLAWRLRTSTVLELPPPATAKRRTQGVRSAGFGGSANRSVPP